MTGASELAWLGDPFDAANPAGFAEAARRRLDSMPPEHLAAQARLRGVSLAYTPVRWGGTLRDPVDSGRSVRGLVSRDADIMTALLMHLTPVLVLGILGSPAQRDRAVAMVEAGEDIAYALSEQDHGADLLEMRTSAQHVGDEVILTGRKWFVGLAPTASTFVVIARSGGRGPAAFSAYEVPAGTPGVRIGPDRPTDGFRGTRFADVELDHVVLPGSALVGERGAALEAVIRAQTVVRALSLPGALAGADSDRMVLTSFADEQRGGGALRVDPLFCADTGEVAAAMLLAEAAGEWALRVLGTRPGGAVLPVALAKYTVIEAIASAHGGIGRLLASRGVLSEGVWGMHAKVAADARVIGVIDGSGVSTLRTVAAFLPRCSASSRGRRREHPGERTAHDAGNTDPGDLGFDPADVGVVPTTSDPALVALEALGGETASLPGAARVTALRSALDEHCAAAARIEEAPRALRPALLVEHARRHAWLSSAAAAVVAAAGGTVGPLALAVGPSWIDAALEHALTRAGRPPSADLVERAGWGAALLDATSKELAGWRTSDR